MAQQLSDTHPKAEQVQLELLREASVARRLALTRSITTSAIVMARSAIERANPTVNERERDLLFVEYHYGSDLAGRVRAYLSGEQR